MHVYKRQKMCNLNKKQPLINSNNNNKKHEMFHEVSSSFFVYFDYSLFIYFDPSLLDHRLFRLKAPPPLLKAPPPLY